MRKGLFTLFILTFLIFSGKFSYAEKIVNPNCTNAGYEKLLSGMSAGDYKSLVTFMRCQSLYGGGNLEDLYIESIGFFKRDPYLYGYILEKEGALTKWDCFPDAFFNFGLPENVDNPTAQKRDILERLELAKKIENEDIRKKAKEALKESLGYYYND